MNNFSISIENAGKRFNREWIFRKLSYNFHSGNAYAITGSNGSGKSTLLQCIAASSSLNEGRIQFNQPINNQILPIDTAHHHQYLSICAPYLELIEEMTTTEFLQFHQQFKPLLSNISIATIIETIGLTKSANKQIRYFSSGMKQRLKLAQAIFSNTPLVLLDEPCTNLDQEGYALYHHLITTYCQQKLVIICSNDPAEIDFCTEQINIVAYK